MTQNAGVQLLYVRKDSWATYALLLMLAAVFWCELQFSVVPGADAFTPLPLTLLALGATTHNSVMLGGEWYRLFTAPLLHASPIHILLNGIVLFYAGRLLESMIGRPWLLAIYGVSGVAGALMSSIFSHANVVSVGASGAIMGLVTAVMVISFHASYAQAKHALRSFSLRILIPSMLPVTLSDGMRIDLFAHCGGVIGGGVAAALMLACWPSTSARPDLRLWAGLVAALCLAGSVLGAYKVAENYPMYVSVGHYRTQCLSQMNPDVASAAEYIKAHAAELQKCIHLHMKQGH